MMIFMKHYHIATLLADQAHKEITSANKLGEEIARGAERHVSFTSRLH